MTIDDFQAQLDRALPPGVQRTLQIQIVAPDSGPYATFTVGEETWRLTYDPTRQHWQLHAPRTGVPLLFLAEELTQSLLVLRAYRMSQLDDEVRTIRSHLTTVLTLRGEQGQEIVLSPQAALNLLDLLIVSEPDLKQLVQEHGREEGA